MKTIYVTVPEKILDGMVDEFKDSNPVTQSFSFSIYLCLEEVKRSRDEIAKLKAENQKLIDTLEWVLCEYGYTWNFSSINRVRAALGLPELEESL